MRRAMKILGWAGFLVAVLTAKSFVRFHRDQRVQAVINRFDGLLDREEAEEIVLYDLDWLVEFEDWTISEVRTALDNAKRRGPGTRSQARFQPA